jgi:prepilin-type N-terminal cleavage/methylation domain-containing protein
MLKKSKGLALSKSKGFTLIELLVVMAIIAIIVTLVIYAINAARMQSRNTQRRNIANTAKAGLEAYYSTYKQYPATPAGGLVYTLLTTAAPGGIQNYATGVAGNQADDPNGQRTRTCYSQNGNNRYYMWVQPEPQAAPASCSVPAVILDSDSSNDAPYEDFSVR